MMVQGLTFVREQIRYGGSVRLSSIVHEADKLSTFFRREPDLTILTFSTDVKKSIECSSSLYQVPFDLAEFEGHLNTAA